MISQHVAAIMAGGNASRMGGTVKGLIEVDGCSILSRQLRVLRPLFDEVIVVANQAAPFAGFGVRVVPDRLVGRGPLAGIATALGDESAPADVFVVAADMPFLSAPIIALIAACGTEVHDVVVPRVNGHFEPLFALYSRRCLPCIDRRLQTGNLKVSALFEDNELSSRHVSVCELQKADPDFRGFLNVNTFEDVDELR